MLTLDLPPGVDEARARLILGTAGLLVVAKDAGLLRRSNPR